MEINKQLFEDVLSGKLKGTFVLKNGKRFNDNLLTDIYRSTVVLGKTTFYFNGKPIVSDYNGILDIVDFIPDTDMKTKIIPFDIELAKKIQAGEIEGKIVTNEGNEVEIIRFNLIQNSFPILAIIRIPNVVSDYWEDAKLFQLNGKHGNEKLWLEIELLEETPKCDDVEEVPTGDESIVFLKYKKREFKPFDKVLVRDYDDCKWSVNFYSHFSDGIHRCVSSCGWKQCIPYEGNEHLVGTTNNPKK